MLQMNAQVGKKKTYKKSIKLNENLKSKNIFH